MELLEQLLPLPDKQFQKKLFNEFNSSEYQRNFDILKNWFEEETGVICNPTYENQIHITLRGAKNDLNTARKRFQNYFLYKTKFPQFYRYNDLRDKFQQFKTFYCLCQPGVTPEGHRISCVGLTSPNVEDFDIDVIFKTLFMIENIGMCLTHPHFLGVLVVVDLKYASAKHAIKVLSWTFRKFQKFNNDVLSLRLSKLFFINVPSIMEKFILIGKAFLSEKLRARLHIEQSDKEMRKHIPVNLLPCDYGGDGEAISLQTKRWFHMLQEVRTWMEAAQEVQLRGNTTNSSTSGTSATYTDEHAKSSFIGDSLTSFNKNEFVNKKQVHVSNLNKKKQKLKVENGREATKELLFEFAGIGDDDFCLNKKISTFERKSHNSDDESELLMPEEFNFSKLEID